MVWRKQHSSHGELSRFLLTSCFFRRCKCRTIWPGWRTWPAILRKQDFHQITQQSGESLAVDHIEQFRCTARSPPCRICLLDDILVAYFAGSEIRWYDGSRLCRIGIYNGRLGLGGAKQISSATNTVWHTLLLVDLSERELATFSMTAQLSEQSIWSMRTEIEDLPWPSWNPVAEANQWGSSHDWEDGARVKPPSSSWVLLWLRLSHVGIRALCWHSVTWYYCLCANCG